MYLLPTILFSVALAYVKCSDESDSLFFVETFDENVITNGKWIKSSVAKYNDQKVLISPSLIATKGFENDNGLRLAADMKHYGISTKFPKPLTVKDQPNQGFVIQYGKQT